MDILTQNWAETKVFGDSGKLSVGDRIRLGEYTATCQKVTSDREYGLRLCTFWLDQPLREGLWTHRDLEERVNRTCRMTPDFEELYRALPGKLRFQIPTVEDIFGWDDFYEVADEDGEQWPLMRITRNRMPDAAMAEDEKYAPTWLKNETEMEHGCYATISFAGLPSFEPEDCRALVRPKFTLALPMGGEEPNED